MADIRIGTPASTAEGSFEQTLVEVWRQALVENAKVVELARAASRLGEADININHGYCGVEPGTNVPLLIFGVAEVGRAVAILEQAAAAAAAT